MVWPWRFLKLKYSGLTLVSLWTSSGLKSLRTVSTDSSPEQSKATISLGAPKSALIPSRCEPSSATATRLITPSPLHRRRISWDVRSTSYTHSCDGSSSTVAVTNSRSWSSAMWNGYTSKRPLVICLSCSYTGSST